MRYCFNDFNNLGCQAFLTRSSNMDLAMLKAEKPKVKAQELKSVKGVLNQKQCTAYY